MNRNSAPGLGQWITVSLMVGVSLFLLYKLYQYAGTRTDFPTGLTIGGVDVGQMTKEEAQVEILNGTGLPQRELIAADLLGWRGVTVSHTGPADEPTVAQTRIIVFRDKPTTVALLMRELDVAEENVVQQPDPDQAADIRVILGADYNPCK